MARTRNIAPRPRRAATWRPWGLALLLGLFASSSFPQTEERYRLLDGTAGSARPTAEKLLRHLAEGDIEAAALLSNAPRRRYEELARYRDAVGENEFKRVYSQFFAPANRVVAEIAIGAHRLLIWDLGEAGHHLAGQYYVQTEGRFLMNDVPGETRSSLRRVLEDYRSGRLRF